MIHYYQTPITANFIVTKNCNGHCRFCGVSHSSAAFYKEVSLDRIKTIIDRLYDAQVLRINYFGGEPTLYPHILEAAAYSKSLEFYNSIVTNGIYVPKDFAQYRDCFDALAVSVHGDEAMHSSLGGVSGQIYRKVLDNLSFYASLNIPLTINMTVTPENYLTIFDFADHLARMFPISAFAFNRFIPSPSVEDAQKKQFVMTAEQINSSLELIHQAAQKYPHILFKYAIHFPYCVVSNPAYLKYVGHCGFGQNYISIDCDGTIQACSYSDHALGNILEDDLKEIWQNHAALTEYRTLEWIPEKCNGCRYLTTCMVGCKVTGTGYFSPDVMLCEAADKKEFK